MLKFIRGKGQQPSAERQKLQRELFAFRKTVQHGFPNKPTALAWDNVLRVAALGTASGAVKVYGRPGGEFYGRHADAEAPVTQLHFLPGTGRLVSLCDDNSLHLWEINENSLVEVKSQALDGKLKKISAICVESTGEFLLLGTEGGNIYFLDLATFTMTNTIIYQEVVMQNCPEDYKLNPGAVECLAEHPTQPRKLLIGYNRGLVVLWDYSANIATHTFVSSQQLESVCWNDDGSHFTSSHNDGSHVQWEVASEPPSLREPVTPYGPYPCKAINKILIRSSTTGDEITIFSGGMPRASYGEKYTVTVQQGDKHVAFDFTSRVIDFFTTTPIPHEAEGEDTVDDASPRPTLAAQLQPSTVRQTASTLLVLAEEELVAIDLTDVGDGGDGPFWRPLRPPYLVSLHASAVTCTQLVDNVAEDVYKKICDAGLEQTKNVYSSSPWPITGGALVKADSAPAVDSEETGRLVMLTGHEDGSVRFWDAHAVTLLPLYKYTTAGLFSGEDVCAEEEAAARSAGEEEEWPPLRRAGSFDPYSDDPRLAVKRAALCGRSATLAVAGAAGHVVLAQLQDTPMTETQIKMVLINIVSDRDGFVWKGHDQLSLRAQSVSFPAGFQPTSVLQIHPPAAVTALALQAEWGLLCAGTAHGLALYDIVRHTPVAHKCTLNPNDHSGAGDAAISRRKSFKKSLRESFRRLRKGRSQRRQTTPVAPTSPTQPAPKKTAPPAVVGSEDVSPLEARPVERPVEARPNDDAFGSMLRCLYFARTFLLNSQSTTPTLWAGTNNGTVYAFSITVPSSNKRKDDAVNCQLAKEIQLKHRAPVIGIAVLDGSSIPLPEPFEVESGVAALPDSSHPHRVVIASEEQFKIFTLPSLKPYCKYKLTAHEGARVRRMAFAKFTCAVEGATPGEVTRHSECCLLCLTNLGDCLVLSVPELRRQLNAAAIRKEDINGISSLSFSKKGEALYLHSSSELQRITLAGSKVTQAHCHLPLAAWAQALRSSETDSPLVNGEHKGDEANESGSVGAADVTNAHDVTTTSQTSHSVGDITVDSVRDHTQPAASATPTTPDRLKIEIQNKSVNESSVVVKTTTRTTANEDNHAPHNTSANTTTTSTNSENILEHTREEGLITRIESGTITVPAGTDPKLILEMFERSRTPLNAPEPTPPTPTNVQ